MLGLGLSFWSRRTGASVTVASGLVAYWPFDTSTTDFGAHTSNDIINGNTVTFDPSVTGVSGKVAQALSFDGSNFASAPNSASLTLTAAISVCAWVNTSSNGRIIAKWDGATTWILEIDATFSLATFWVDAAGGGTLNAQSADVIGDGTWHHMAGTYDGANIKIYIDGLLKATTPQTGAISTNTHAIYMGADESGGTDYNGLLDDARIYNRALSQTEVTAIYAAGVAGHR